MATQDVVFRGGALGLFGVLGLIALEGTLTRLLGPSIVPGITLPAVDITVGSATVSLVVLVATWRLLSWEGIDLSALGIGRSHAVPALLTVGLFFALLNIIAAGLALAAGHPETIGYHWTVPPAEALVVLLIMFVLAGLLEELLFRGYLQTKLAAVIGGGVRGISVSIVLASLIFAAYHIPRIIVEGTPDETTAVMYLAGLTVSGLVYGLLYEWTQNLWIPVFVHTAGNAPGTAGIVFVLSGGWPAWAVVGYQLAYLASIAAVVLAYRRCGRTHGFFPVWNDRRDTQLSAGGTAA